MKIFSSEFAYNYGTYSFGYTNYCEIEAGDIWADVYERGFLPYSGAHDIKKVFYMARSARVVLEKWSLSSENRRIAKKFDGVFTKERIALKEFTADETFFSFCLDYFAQKHGPAAMSRARLDHILASGLITHIVIYRKGTTPVAYVLEIGDTAFGHYWFSFYDLSYTRQSLGLWLMLDCVRASHERGCAHYYLGTVYGEKALYKTNFEPLEWWDGTGWSSDIKLLRERGRHDGARLVVQKDVWKEDQNLF